MILIDSCQLANWFQNIVLTWPLGKLQKWEVPRKVKLCSEVWMPESGLITDAFKLKRRAISDYYKDDIKNMYYGK